MPMHNLIEGIGNYSKTYGSLWQYYRDEPHDAIVNSKPFKPNTRITENTPAGNTDFAEIAVPI